MVPGQSPGQAPANPPPGPPAATYPQHARALLVLGIPLIGSHLAQFAIHITDAIMLGWYDVTALAAVTLAGAFYISVFLFGSGFAWAVMPLVAEAAEAGDDVQVRRVTRMGLWLSVIFGLVFTIPMMWSEAIFLAIGQDPEVAAQGQMYLRIAAWALVPGLMVMTLKSFLSALERTAVILWVTVATAVLNIVVNYALIFGNWGFPELGIRGAAIASLVLVAVSVVVLIVYAIWSQPRYSLFQRMWRIDRRAFVQVYRLGWPIGLTTLAEVGLFSAAAVMVGWIGPLELAAHGIAIQLSSAAFMIHVGLSQAATVRAGRALGRRDEVALRRGGKTAIAMSLFFAALTVAAFLSLPEPLVAIFLDPAEPSRDAVMRIGVTLLALAALFQVADALQVMALGLLRGVQDTGVPMIYATVSYWLVGMPTSYVLGFVFGFGAVGIWLGLVFGLSCAAVLMLARFWGRSVRIAAAPAPAAQA